MRRWRWSLALAVGFLNGYLVMKTKIPSFLITLSSFFMLAGINLAVTKLVVGPGGHPERQRHGGLRLRQQGLRVVVHRVRCRHPRSRCVWWLVFTAIATWVLFKTKIGNWIFAVGGDADSARAVGVPVTKVKIGLFMFVGFCAWFVGMHLLFAFNTVQSGQGIGNEFFYIIAAVIGGCLLTGGYGTAIGAADRCVHLRHDQPGHRLRRLGSRLVQVLPRRDAAVRGDRQQRLP